MTKNKQPVKKTRKKTGSPGRPKIKLTAAEFNKIELAGAVLMNRTQMRHFLGFKSTTWKRILKEHADEISDHYCKGVTLSFASDLMRLREMAKDGNLDAIKVRCQRYDAMMEKLDAQKTDGPGLTIIVVRRKRK